MPYFNSRYYYKDRSITVKYMNSKTCRVESILSKRGKKLTASSACAACKMHSKKCSKLCVLAPHFPSDDPDKFAVVQRVFGTSHIAKMLQGVDHNQRRHAVSSMVNEAAARLKDPIHGSAGAVHQLQQKIAELKSCWKSRRQSS